MATTAELTENSRQGFDLENPDSAGLDDELSRNLHWGYGHAYDETPAGLAVYVRNDPVNLVDPDGRWWECGEWSEGSCIDYVFDPTPHVNTQQRDTGGWLRSILGIGSFDQRVNRALNKLENKLAPENISDDCKELFKTLARDPAVYLAKLKSLQFIDGTMSSDKIEDQVSIAYANATHTLGWTVARLFHDNFPDNPPNTQLNGWTPPNGNNVYLRPESGTSAPTVGHEIFHKLGLYDPDLVREEWGMNPKGPSSQFDQYFKKKCL